MKIRVRGMVIKLVRCIGGSGSMDRFIKRENIKHYRELLGRTTDAFERERIMKLLAEEESRQQPGEPPASGVRTSNRQ